MADIEITRNPRANEKLDVPCRECKRSTKQVVLSDFKLKGKDGDFLWNDEYQIVQFQGCETISFRKAHENCEDFHVTDSNELAPNFTWMYSQILQWDVRQMQMIICYRLT